MRRGYPKLGNLKMARALLLVASLATYPAICAARTLEVIAAPRLIMAAVSVQELTVAKYVGITTDTATVDSWMAAGTSALQADNSDAYNTDVTCPVRLSRREAIATFSDPRFEDIDTQAKWVELSTTVLQTVKIVSHLTWCLGNPPDSGGVYTGCAYNGQIVVAADSPMTPETLAHEYGHYKGRGHERTTERWLMFGEPKPNRNIVDGNQCEAFAR